MKNTQIFGLILLLTMIAACTKNVQINSFEECIAAGNPEMESNPPKCQADGKVFTKELAEPPTEEEPVLEPTVQEPKVFHECTVEESDAVACTMDYNPVCGLIDNGIRCIKAPCQSSDAKTYANGCGACSAKAYGYYPGACEELEFVVCNGEEAKTGFSPEEYAKNYGGICVDVCPGNYDPYMTQIGVTLCIEHYGQDKIEELETCKKSTDSCNCVKAYETTDDQQVDDPQYRCVPDRYAQRLLFRGGQDRLDENGEQSVMIA